MMAMKRTLVSYVRERKADVLLCCIVLALALHALYCYSFSDSGLAFVLACVTTLFVACFYLFVCVRESRRPLKIETVFLIGLIGCGVFYTLVFSPGSAPDEPFHYRASYELADNLMFLGPADGSLPMREDDIAFHEYMLNSMLLTYGHYQELIEQFGLFVQQSSYGSIDPGSGLGWGANPPYIKLPSALGIVIGSVFQLGSVPTFYLGRFFNFLLFALLAFFAVRITPIGKNVFVLVGLLPMTLHITSSYSYDAGILGLAFLLTALCLREIYGEGILSRRRKIEIITVAVLLAPCKVVYTVIVLLVFLIPRDRFVSARSALCFKLLALGCSLVAIVLLRASTLLDMAGVSSDSTALNTIGTQEGSLYRLSDLLFDPVNTGLIFVRTLDALGSHYLNSLVGGSLGWFQAEIAAPLYLTFALLFMLILSAQRSSDDTVVIPGSQRALFGGLAVVGVLGTMLSMLLAWTFTGENTIQGVQGRYFLPLLPLGLLALRSKQVKIDAPLGMWLLYGMIALNMAYLSRIFARAVGV